MLYRAPSTAMRSTVHGNDCLDSRKQASLQSFANGRSRMNVSDVNYR